jgi:hypothetical protein
LLFSAVQNVAPGPFQPSWRVAGLVVIKLRAEVAGWG